jgi:glucan 1,4-alpha-glucosidase
VLGVLTTAAAAPAAALADPAPGRPGVTARWTTGAKQGVGTSANVESKVWYTLSEGVLSEIYYPQVDVADTRALELAVTDGRTFTDRETTGMTHRIEVSADALTHRQINTDKQRRYRITKSYVTDPDRATVLVRVKFESLDGGRYQVFALLDPSLANSGLRDSAESSRGALLARDTSGELKVASALVADVPFLATSNGYEGSTSDGWIDLRRDHRLDGRWTEARNGNVVQTAQLALGATRSSQVTLALGFGTSQDRALMTARDSLRRSFGRIFRAYVAGWTRYLSSLNPAPASVRSDRELRKQYRIAAMTLRAHEDKTYRGANIASLTVPWGQAVNANEAGVGGYHLVWSRDLYQVATAQLAIGDAAAANRSLDYLFEVQQLPDGSFPQNSLLDGTPYWTSLQLDEVAFPIVLAWQLGRFDGETYRDHVKKAADFIVGRGPATPQERWEEEGGFSPSTIASEIAGLTAAADIARRNGDDASAALYQGVADDWQRRVEGWTFTTTGPLGDGRYFERIDDNGNPDDGGRLDINNGGGNWDEREVVDGGFLELVRLGVKPADDPAVLASLPELDETIKVDTPNGPMWYRYNHDGYGEKADGSPYDGTGVGRLWPLLTGERGEYELAAGRTATEHLRTMARAGNEGYMIPEQVWDREEPTRFGFRFGEGTGSATPLAWSMAQYLRLAVSIDAGRPVETPSVVAERYAQGELPAAPALAVTSPAPGTTTGEATVAVTGTTDAEAVYVFAGGRTTEVPVTDGTFTYDAALTLGTNTLTVVAVGADGRTATEQISITSTNFGTPLGAVGDPTGDDNGPGSYVYPTNGAFNPGAFDLTRFAVYDAGTSYNFVTTIAGELRNPWGGNQIAVQRLNVYVRTGTGTGATPALPGTNVQLAAPYDRVINAAGFDELGVRDASGAMVSGAQLLALPATRQIVVTVPKTAFGDADLAQAQFAVGLGSHAGGGEGTGSFRPVYDRAYWESTAGTGMSFIREYRFGGGAGEFDGGTDARDTDTRDPNLIDVLVGEGQSQSTVLDWTAGAPATLPYVALGDDE